MGTTDKKKLTAQIGVKDQAKLLLSGWKKMLWKENISPISPVLPRCSQAQGTIKLTLGRKILTAFNVQNHLTGQVTFRFI
jgi:hypothetical protein